MNLKGNPTDFALFGNSLEAGMDLIVGGKSEKLDGVHVNSGEGVGFC